MYVLRISRYDGHQQPSSKPDGMFVYKEGLFTDNKNTAKLFTTEKEAEEFSKLFNDEHPMFIIEVEVKPVVARVGKIIRKV